MRNVIAILFLLIGGFCFWQITELLRDGILPLWLWALLVLAGIGLVGLVAYLRFLQTRPHPDD